MFAAPELDHDAQHQSAKAASAQPQVSVLLGHRIISEDHHIATHHLDGTIRASVDTAGGPHTYRRTSTALIHGVPIEAAPRLEKPEPARSTPKPAAKDLIAEINVIREQIQMMMCQVERAVSRLTASV